ncbi:hypothetical protein ACLOJK_020905 [Asimina triloba]
MMSGERRWVNARRGSLTVLGKVAVPKPVNLPSQRLENHGLDPNVEIVPKSICMHEERIGQFFDDQSVMTNDKSSHVNGTAGSSGHLNGRPSSGGSGTRPSTAGSDRSHEPSANAWGSNSRPSSASGILASNQTPMSSPRPRSAETRPGSSQLSRFAESISENSGPWGGSTAAEKLGTASSRSSEFTLSSGDFPTLGSEKSSEMPSRQGLLPGHSSHGRPGSASSGTPIQKESASSPNEDGPVHAIDVKVSINTWRRDASPYNEGGTPPSMEKWQRDPQLAQPYPNPNMPSHHFDPWHGTPIRNPPDGVWYRGGPPGGPYGPGGPPGSYPLEPFGYYHSQLPARPIPNSQAGPFSYFAYIPARPVPNSQVGPRAGISTAGYNPQPGETYHPRMPDSYSVPAAPVIPVRPGVYPGPVPYDGYYGPHPMSFCNPNEKDTPNTGTVPPHIYNRFSNQNACSDPGNFPARPVPFGPGSAMVKEQMESDQSPDAHRGPYKVLLKQHDGWGENDSEDNNEHSTAASMRHSEKGISQRKPIRENDWEVDHRKNEPEDLSKSVVGEESPSQPLCNQQGRISVAPVNPPENKVNAVDGSLLKKPEPMASPSEGPQHIPVIKKDAALIDKIEGLNTKARISDGRNEARVTREEKEKQLGIMNAKGDLSASGSVRSAVLKEKSYAGGVFNPPHKGSVDVSITDGGHEPTAVGRVMSNPEETQASADSIVGDRIQSQMRGQAMQGRADYRGKGRFSSHESEEWRKKPAGTSTSVMIPARNVDAQLGMCMQDLHNFEEVPKKEESNPPDNAGTEPYVTSSVDATDYKAQRAKMKELATQRAKQLQQEEEERTREQRAKALAKLEELNRRKLMENQTQKLECTADQLKQEEHLGGLLSQTHTGIGGEASGPSSYNSDTAIQAGENVIKIKESMESSSNRTSEDSVNHATKTSVVAMDQSVHLTSDAPSTEFATEKSISQFPDGGGQNQKQMGYKRKQNASHERNLPEKMAASGITAVQDNADSSASIPSAESSVPSNANTKDDHPQQQQQHKKRSNRVSKNKHKTDESLSIATLPSSEPTEMSSAKALTETKKTVTPETVSTASSDKAETSRAAVKVGDSQHEGLVSAGHGLSQLAEEAHGRTTGHWKAQSHRRVSRNTQSIRPVEKFHGNEGTIWAPVRTPINKSEPSDESNQFVNMNSGLSSGKTSHGMQSNLMKGKRAEMERYVPKPVAKELSQQENSLGALAPALSDVEAIKSDHGSQSTKNSGQDHSAHGKTGLEVKNAEVKHNKNGKVHASWRQRSPVESSTGLQSPKEKPTSFSDTTKIMHKPADQQHIPKADFPTQKEQEKLSDGWNMDPVLQEVTAPIIVKDGGAGRVKRQQSKAQRSSGHSHSLGDRKDAEEPVNKTDYQPITFGSIEMDASTPRNENQAKIDHASIHWQPKPQAHSTQNRQGRRVNGGQRQFHEKESSHIPTKVDKDATAQVQLHEPDAHKASIEMNDPHHQEAKREVKGVHSSKEQTNTLNRVPPRSTELVSDNVDSYYREELVSTGMHWQGQHGGRFNRGQEATYGGGRGNSVHDGNKQQMPTNADRRKHGSHYEYQPVGSYNRPDNSFRQEEVHERSQAMSSRYRERGQNHPRRGGQFYGRNSGGSAVRVATTYSNEN